MVRGATAKSALCNENKTWMDMLRLLFRLVWSVGPPEISKQPLDGLQWNQVWNQAGLGDNHVPRKLILLIQTLPPAPPWDLHLWLWVKCLTNYCLNYYEIWYKLSCPPPPKISQLSGGDSITWHLHQIIILIDLKKIKQNEWYSHQLQLSFVFRANKQMLPPKPNALKKRLWRH